MGTGGAFARRGAGTTGGPAWSAASGDLSLVSANG